MKKGQSILIILLLLILSGLPYNSLFAQKENRLSIQISPLLSYFNLKGKYTYINNYEISSPKVGIRSAIKFEKDLSKALTLNTGLSYEFRRTYYETGFLYDTSQTFIGGDNQEPYSMPYKMFFFQTYNFIGIPFSISINYINQTNFTIYQTLGTQISYLFYGKIYREDYRENSEALKTIKKMGGDKHLVFSLYSTIGFRKIINENIDIEIEPGLCYMINSFIETSTTKDKFFDLRLVTWYSI